MKRAALALLSFLSLSNAMADEISIVGHGFSKHLDNHNFREKNYGAGIRYEHDDFGLQVGAYQNSIYKNSAYLGIDWNALQYDTKSCVKFQAGAYYGAVTGYKYAITPVAGLQAAIRCDDVFVRVRAMPDPYYNSKAIGAVEFGFVVKRF